MSTLFPTRPQAPVHDQRPEDGSCRIAMISTCGYVAAEPPLGARDTADQVIYVLELSRELARLGHRVDIWTRRFEDQPASEIVGERVRILRVPCGGREFIAKEQLHRSLDEWVQKALRAIQQSGLGYDFISSHYWDAGIAGRSLAKALNVSHLHTPHSLGLWKLREMHAGSASEREATARLSARIEQERQIYREANVIIATTPTQLDVLHDQYGVSHDKLHMVPAGFDATRFFPVSPNERAAARRRFDFDGKVVLAFARPTSEGGCDLLIHAFREVAERIPEARLHLHCGFGTCSEPELQTLAEYRQLAAEFGLQNRVTFADPVPAAALPDLYRAADIFVLPSRYEPFGMAAIEAMACGTPVVATTHGGLAKALNVGVEAIFADASDRTAFAAAIARPLVEPLLWESLAHLGAAAARNTFKWSAVVQDFAWALELCNREAESVA